MEETYEEKGLLGSIVHWFSHPFSQDGDPVNWILFAGVAFVAAWMWVQVLSRIRFE